MRSFLLCSLAAGAALIAAPRPAAACSRFGNEPLQIVSSDDTVAPTPPVQTGLDVGRAEAQGSCGDIGWIDLHLTATDDRAAPAQLGYELTLRSGTLPAGLTLPTGPVRPLVIDYFVFYFDPSDRDLAFELEVRAVDLAGNRSAPTVVAIVDHAPAPDEDDGGCAAGGAGPHALGPAAVALALLVARRRRRARA